MPDEDGGDTEDHEDGEGLCDGSRKGSVVACVEAEGDEGKSKSAALCGCRIPNESVDSERGCVDGTGADWKLENSEESSSGSISSVPTEGAVEFSVICGFFISGSLIEIARLGSYVGRGSGSIFDSARELTGLEALLSRSADE